MLCDFDEVDLGVIGADLILAIWSKAEDLLHDVVKDEQCELPAVEPVVPRLERQEQILVLLDVLGHVATPGLELLFCFFLLFAVDQKLLKSLVVVRTDDIRLLDVLRNRFGAI